VSKATTGNTVPGAVLNILCKDWPAAERSPTDPAPASRLVIKGMFTFSAGRGLKGKTFSHRAGSWAALRGTRQAARNSQPRGEGIGQELMGECVGLPRGSFVPASNSRDIGALIGKGVQNP